MDTKPIVYMAEKIHGLSQVKQLDPSLVNRLWLNVGKSFFDRLDLEGCYSYQAWITQNIQPELQMIWESCTDKNYVIQCGDAVYVSQYEFTQLDQNDLANRMEFLATVMLRPTVEKDATIIPISKSQNGNCTPS